MKKLFPYGFLVLCIACIGIWACSSSDSTTSSSSATCSLTDNTTETSTVNSYGCYLLTRDVTDCQSERTSQGLSGFWLNFSCRVSLTKSGSDVVIAFDSQPDSKSQYFDTSDGCYEAFSNSDRFTNPNTISEQDISMTVPYNPTVTSGTVTMPTGVVGVAMNGVSIYDNEAAPGDSIYDENESFDKCDGHPDSGGRYHYHAEMNSISNNDYAFVGVMRDGYPIYGRKDQDGSTPSLDSTGGHSGTTPDSGSVTIYHYHVNPQTDTSQMPNETIYFITKGIYKGTPGSCTGCN